MGTCRTALAESPQFAFVSGKSEPYKAYLKEFQGQALQDDHSPGNLAALADELDYLGDEHPNHYIIVKEIEAGRYVILDGLHRASILKQRGQADVIVAVIL